MKTSGRRWMGLAACVAAGIILLCWRADIRPAKADDAKAALNGVDQPAAPAWDQKAAASYLDQRAGWWMGWPKAARDHETFCVSCHTAVPYAMARPALRGALGEQQFSANEQRILENVKKRVRLWKEVEPFYKDADRGPYKSVESRGTESVLNALILSSADSRGGHLSAETRTALENMWAEQQTNGERKGGWLWLRFKNEPWEADDSDYYGAALATIAVGTAPENYGAGADVQNNLKMLREYLNREYTAQTLSNRAVLLWASAKVLGLIEADRKKEIVAALLNKQQADGGWSLTTISGDWKRHDGTPQEEKSDGYATGLVTFALMQTGMRAENPQVKRGLAWLAENQNKKDGYWAAYSLNNNEANHISPDTWRFMKDAATAYAVLALSESASR